MRSTPFISFLAFLALAFAEPVHAQQVDQQTHQQVVSTVERYVDALNKGDGQAMVALFVPNPVSIYPRAKITSPAQMKNALETAHRYGLAITAKVEEVELLFGGQGAVATVSYSGTISNPPRIQKFQGHILFVLERAGDGWKIRASSASRSLPPDTGATGILQLAQSDGSSRMRAMSIRIEELPGMNFSDVVVAASPA